MPLALVRLNLARRPRRPPWGPAAPLAAPATPPRSLDVGADVAIPPAASDIGPRDGLDVPTSDVFVDVPTEPAFDVVTAIADAGDQPPCPKEQRPECFAEARARAGAPASDVAGSGGSTACPTWR